MIKHIVMWKLKDPTDAKRFAALLERCQHIVPGMVDFEVATASHQLEANADVVLYSVFATRSALNDYQDHPIHKSISGELGAMRESRMVLDYEAGLTDSVAGPDTFFPETVHGGM